MSKTLPSVRSLDDVVLGSPYVSYLYSYPHKSAYRALKPTRDLDALWHTQDCSSLFLYVHVPFCEMRCGFCNLFTVVGTEKSPVHAYVRTLGRQARRLSQILGNAGFARVAIGGGTPTFLDERSLHDVLDIVETTMGADISGIPVSVETSPETARLDRLRALCSRGVDRISIGVQSFHENEVRAIGRAQTTARVCTALERIRGLDVSTLNIDLMYGLPEQTMDSWLDSIERACAFAPEELYLYPLYVRPRTGLARSSRARWREDWDLQRLRMYREGRDLLLDRGYRQRSMRMFQMTRPASPVDPAPVYTCQQDGMVGLGAGARSYTDTVHYSTHYAVGSKTVKSIIDAYVDTVDCGFDVASYGVELGAGERRRRHVILSLFHHQGLDLPSYRRRFGTDAVDDFPPLAELVHAGLAERRQSSLVLTESGMERSDAIGPWLHSERVRRLMAGFELR